MSTYDLNKIQPLDLTEKRTVFVLGAGASKPYAFPLGSELKSKIIDYLPHTAFKGLIQERGFSKSLLDDFAEALAGTNLPTIDIFLEKKPSFRQIGAYAIAYTLFKFENHHQIFPYRDWYGHIYNILNFENNSPDTGKITFVTLNYDRSLEYFLSKSPKFNCSENKMDIAHEKLQKLSIIHAHGSLGHYPDVQFGLEPTPASLVEAVKGILIVSDKLEDSKDFITAKQAIFDADNIVFIGFGYDRLTMKKLIPKPKDFGNKRLLGTVFNLPKSSRDFIEEYFNGKFEITPDHDISAEGFIKQIFPS